MAEVADREQTGRDPGRETDRFRNEMLNDDLLSLPSSLVYAVLKSPHCLARRTKGTLVQGEPEAAQFSLPIPEEHHSLLSPARRLKQHPSASFLFQRVGRVRAAADRASSPPGTRAAAGQPAAVVWEGTGGGDEAAACGEGWCRAGAAPQIPRPLPSAFKTPRERFFPVAPRICQAPRGLVSQCLPATGKSFFSTA